ncbi:MAG: 3-deoxy-7-phosphoheptulonate synthase [Oceanospirillaceae bacterium]|nr:3-deoxy-7-phosphoheptulonate synthase [Oceanospirillaceae bacterium]|tara:strand:- start:96617 stop:97669 length:1053 start_codon:yes stop_codon:yes gene_type:complete
MKTNAEKNTTTTTSNDPAVRPLSTPRQLKADMPLSEELAVQVEQQRQQIRDLLEGNDQRLLIVTGPCSIHDEEAVLDYGRRLAGLNEQLKDKLLIVMRAYVEKPRTSVGWKGLAYDPARNGKGDMAEGIRRSRAVMLKLANMGLPLATEALNPLVMRYLDDLISWTAIGARTSESQTHREMVSHLPMPVGIKNSTDGSASNAINAMISARHSHHTLGVDVDGQMAMLDTPGNADTHLVLRGGHGLTNYDAESIAASLAELQKGGCHEKVMVDCSHANACKQHDRQIPIAHEVVDQRIAGNDGILGLMLESFIAAGRQNDSGELLYGQSITDACIGWEETESLLRGIYAKL